MLPPDRAAANPCAIRTNVQAFASAAARVRSTVIKATIVKTSSCCHTVTNHKVRSSHEVMDDRNLQHRSRVTRKPRNCDIPFHSCAQALRVVTAQPLDMHRAIGITACSLHMHKNAKFDACISWSRPCKYAATRIHTHGPVGGSSGGASATLLILRGSSFSVMMLLRYGAKLVRNVRAFSVCFPSCVRQMFFLERNYHTVCSASLNAFFLIRASTQQGGSTDERAL